VRTADLHFASINKRASTLPGVGLHVTDGRNFLLLSQRKYDVISVEITSIWFAGAASLYNQEFYQLARSRLARDGVLQQWLQLHHLSPLDVLSVMSTARAEFRYVSLYELGGQGVLVATNDAVRANPSPEAIALLTGSAQLKDVRRIAGREIASLTDDTLLGPDGVDRYIADVGIDGSLWLSTDNNLALEYSSPKANVNDSASSYATNRALLAKYR
jgi:hypothetical protein